MDALKIDNDGHADTLLQARRWEEMKGIRGQTLLVTGWSQSTSESWVEQWKSGCSLERVSWLFFVQQCWCYVVYVRALDKVRCILWAAYPWTWFQISPYISLPSFIYHRTEIVLSREYYVNHALQLWVMPPVEILSPCSVLQTYHYH